MHAEQQWVSWSFLETLMQMRGLVDMFGGMGWRKLLEFKYDWNEAVI
jgi:hypothetical protein